MADYDTQILRPLSLIVPQISGANLSKAEKGMLFISGAKLYFVSAIGAHELITST